MAASCLDHIYPFMHTSSLSDAFNHIYRHIHIHVDVLLPLITYMHLNICTNEHKCYA